MQIFTIVIAEKPCGNTRLQFAGDNMNKIIQAKDSEEFEGLTDVEAFAVGLMQKAEELSAQPEQEEAK